MKYSVLKIQNTFRGNVFLLTRISLFILLLFYGTLFAENEKKVKLNDHLISNAFFRPEFENYLRSDPILLTSLNGGCRIWRLPDKRILVIAVGVCTTKNKNYAQIISDVGDKPYAELIKFRNGVTTSLYRRYESRIVNNTEIQKTREIIKSFSIGHIYKLPVIAHWYSLDKSFYFQAVGDFLK